MQHHQQPRHPVGLPVLALDPSSTKLGWALLDAGPRYLSSGVVALSTADPSTRIRYAGDHTRALLESLRPGSVVVEIPNYITDRANARNLWLYARAVGAVEYIVQSSGVQAFCRDASEHRGVSNKEACRRFFLETVGRHATTDDESDALMIGWTFLINHTPMPWQTSGVATSF